MARYFDKLCSAETVTPHDLIETLKEYAEGGWGIDARTVLELVERAKPSPAERTTLRELAEKGFRVQDRRGETKDAKEYRRVAEQL